MITIDAPVPGTLSKDHQVLAQVLSSLVASGEMLAYPESGIVDSDVQAATVRGSLHNGGTGKGTAR